MICSPMAQPSRDPRGFKTMVNNSHVFNLSNCSVVERFSNDCRKSKTKVITATNHNGSKQRDEPITIPSNYL